MAVTQVNSDLFPIDELNNIGFAEYSIQWLINDLINTGPDVSLPAIKHFEQFNSSLYHRKYASVYCNFIGISLYIASSVFLVDSEFADRTVCSQFRLQPDSLMQETPIKRLGIVGCTTVLRWLLIRVGTAGNERFEPLPQPVAVVSMAKISTTVLRHLKEQYCWQPDTSMALTNKQTNRRGRSGRQISSCTRKP